MAQAHRARAARLVEPRRDRTQQIGGLLASGHLGAGDTAPAVRLEDQQDTLCTAELADLVDQKLVQSGVAAQLVEPSACVDQALEGFARVARDRQVRQAPGVAQAARARLAQPCAHDVAVGRDLAEVAAAQPVVVDVAHAFEHQRVGALQRRPGFLGTVVGRERPRQPPPDVLAMPVRGECVVLPAMDVGRTPGCAHCGLHLALLKQRLRQQQLQGTLLARLGVVRTAQRSAHPRFGIGGAAFGQRQRGRAHGAFASGDRVAVLADQRVIARPQRARGGQVAHLGHPEHQAAGEERGAQRDPDLVHRADADVRQPARVPIQAHLGEGGREVADDDDAAAKIAAPVVRGRGALQQIDALGDVFAGEGEHVQRVTEAEQVAALARQLRRTLGRLARRGFIGAARLRERDQPLRATQADADRRCARRSSRRGVLGRAPHRRPTDAAELRPT